MGWVITMCESHNLAFIRTCCDPEMRRACIVELNNKRMIASNGKRGGEFIEQPSPIMRYRRGPSVHRATCTCHAPTENVPNALVSETNSENWNATGQLADNGTGYSGFRWGAWTRRDDNCARLQINHIADAHCVVPDHLGSFAEFMQIACNVEDERVVVVDDDDQNAPDLSAQKASKIRRALASVSSYSASDFDIAVMPLLTCHCEFPPEGVRVRPEEGRTDEASKVHGRADYRGIEGA